MGRAKGTSDPVVEVNNCQVSVTSDYKKLLQLVCVVQNQLDKFYALYAQHKDTEVMRKQILLQIENHTKMLNTFCDFLVVAVQKEFNPLPPTTP